MLRFDFSERKKNVVPESVVFMLNTELAHGGQTVTE